MIIPIIEVIQPIGVFYLSSLKASFLTKHFKVNARQYDEDLNQAFGIQRKLNEKRVRDISNYTEDPDATFPTCIILSISSNDFNYTIIGNEMEFDGDSFIAEVIDGQHRIEGIKNSQNTDQFDLPVALLFELTEEEKAYIFSTINGNQQKVDTSLIYDLFTISDKRSPYKTAHEIARSLNLDNNSPYKGRLKMLGRKISGEETISQGAFVNYLLPLLTNDPKKDLVDEKLSKKLLDNEEIPFRYNYMKNDDAFIYKVLINYFNSFKDVFPEEWYNTEKYILTRSTGFGAMMLALKGIAKNGLFKKDLTYSYFHTVAENFKNLLFRSNKELTSVDFPSNIQMQRILQRMIEECSEF